MANSSGWLLPAGTFHMVTTRPSPNDANQVVLCTEPSPDWAIAFGEALQLSAEGKAPSGIGASLSGSSSDTEAVTALVGRTAGVVALRDGLYAACQAYANHVIGKDAYSLIISQYGDLLVSLAGVASAGSAAADTGAGKPVAATTVVPSGVAVAVTTAGGSGSGSSAAAPKTDAVASSPNSQVAVMQQEIVQALLTTCITNADPTEKANRQGNSLLTAPGSTVCSDLIKNVVTASGELLKPQTTAAPGGNSPGQAAKKVAVPDPAILALQIKLKAAGADLVADGVYGPKTKAAMLKYPSAL